LKQDSLGVKSWNSFAAESGIVDTVDFARCMENSSTHRRIARDTVLVRELGARGTPTILVNGLRWRRRPSIAQFDSLVRLSAVNDKR
jgi:protein-disulfide isomerase